MSLQEEINATVRTALLYERPDDIVAGVKSAVARELNALSPDAHLVFTTYYNHTYMPDMILEWREGKTRRDRPVFIRNSVALTITGEDLTELAAGDPIVLSLSDSSGTAEELDEIRSQAASAPSVLVTDVSTVAQIAEPAIVIRPEELANGVRARSPLLELVQANLLRGGRGLLDQTSAHRLTLDSQLAEEDGRLNALALERFDETAGALFTNEALLRLRRASSVLHLGLGSQDAVSADLPGMDYWELPQGVLSEAELRILLPFLLGRSDVTRDPSFWTYIGSMMDLEMLETLWTDLAGVDLGLLVIPNLRTWTAKRALLVVNGDYDKETQTSPDNFWQLKSRLLCANLGPWRVFLSRDARRLPGKPDGIASSWTDLASPVTGYILDSVDLRGLARRILVSAEQSGDVKGDVAAITATLDDEFQVTNVSVRETGSDSGVAVAVDLLEMTATARREVNLGTLARMAFELVGHRRPMDPSSLLGDFNSV